MLNAELRNKNLRALFAEWRKLSPGIEVRSQESGASVESEREARLAWANQQLKSRNAKVESWGDLTPGELRRLIRVAREESGSGPAYRAQIIARLAVDLWGPQWDEILRRRLQDRFARSRACDLSPRDARAMIEELKSRIVRKSEIRNSNFEIRVSKAEY